MEKYNKNLKSLIKYLLNGFVAIFLLEMAARELLRLIRFSTIPTSLVIAVILAIIFKNRIAKFFKPEAGKNGDENNE
jgi:putative flippase GtrA